MRSLLVIGLVAAASWLESSAHAQAGQDVVVEGKRAGKPEKKICRASAPPTGSRLGARRVCRTAYDWDMEEKTAQRALERDQALTPAISAWEQNRRNGMADQGPR
jgi:hypothetical protein